jgi:3-methyladenine DNA glycosylase AlkD
VQQIAFPFNAILPMTTNEVLDKLKSLGNERVRKQNAKNGAGENQFGVMLGDIRKIAKSIKTDHDLALSLWETGNLDARFLAILIMDLKAISKKDLEKLVRSVDYAWLADWLYSYIVKEFPDKETLREKWMDSSDPMTARLGWSLTSGRVAREPKGLDLPALLDRIESQMPAAHPWIQWTMNSTLANIGINIPEHRDRAIAIGEKLGIYRDYPVSKGCTSPFAPIWIQAMVSRAK